MKIVDIERKGNVVRFYLGQKTANWGWTNPNYKDFSGNTPKWLKPSDTFYGDDWDDIPYESNAGSVYDQFVYAHRDIAFDFDDTVLMPEDDYSANSPYCKDDFIKRVAPFLIAINHAAIAELDIPEYDITYPKVLDAVQAYENSHGHIPNGVSLYYLGDAMNDE